MYDSISKEDIKQALEKILSSPKFSKSPILSRFLHFIVLNTIDGHGNQIKEYTVGIKVLNKPHNFNPQLDASVRIHAVRLRKTLAEYYQLEGSDATIRIEMPKGSYKTTFSKNTNGYFENKLETASVEIMKEDSICILPFTGFIQHPSPDFSIVGFCEFLSDKLSLFQDIKVVSFDTASQFMDEGGSLETIGKDLGVTYYLSGSIELDKEQIRVTFQLFESEGNSFIRSQQIEVSLLSSTVMEAAEKITDQMVASLAGYRGMIHYNKLKDINHPPPASNKSANAIFWFYHYLLHHTPALFYKALQNLEALAFEEGDCALCHAILAHLYINAVIYNYETTRNPLEAARAEVEKAFQIDPECQHAQLVMGWLHVLSRNKAEALNSLEKTVAINPYTPDFWGMCSLGLSFIGEYAKSFEYLKKSRELNPVPYWSASLPDYFWALKNHEYEKMLFYARKISTPSAIFEHIFEMIALYYLGKTDEIKKLVPDYLKKYPTGIAFAAHILPKILFDDELTEKIIIALQQIGQMDEAKTADT
jgi:TolB-like protein